MRVEKIFLKKWGTRKTDFVFSTDRVIMKMMVNREGLLLNVGLVFYTSLILMNIPICEQNSLHTESTGDQTQNSLNESPVSYCDTAVIFSSN
jgi:hypothetical protein